jgi:ribosomal protein L32
VAGTVRLTGDIGPVILGTAGAQGNAPGDRKRITVRRWLQQLFNPPRTCPQCGVEGRRRHTVCRNCGYSFRTGQPAPQGPDADTDDQLDRD